MSLEGYDELLSIFDEDLPTPPVLTGHTYFSCSHSYFNTPPDHPDRKIHVDMNENYEKKYPSLKVDYESTGTLQIATLPIYRDKYTQRVGDYSHDILYMMLTGSSVEDIDRFIDLINNDVMYCIEHPPFRFRYLNVICVTINRYPSSKNVLC